MVSSLSTLCQSTDYKSEHKSNYNTKPFPHTKHKLNLRIPLGKFDMPKRQHAYLRSVQQDREQSKSKWFNIAPHQRTMPLAAQVHSVDQKLPLRRDTRYEVSAPQTTFRAENPRISETTIRFEPNGKRPGLGVRKTVVV